MKILTMFASSKDNDSYDAITDSDEYTRCKIFIQAEFRR